MTENGFTHGDISARNVLVMDDGMVKLCDFGLARDCKDTSQTTQGKHIVKCSQIVGKK